MKCCGKVVQFVLLILMLLLYANKADIFKQYEELMLSEKGRQAKSVLESDLVGSEDSPKEIEIICKEVILDNYQNLILGKCWSY